MKIEFYPMPQCVIVTQRQHDCLSALIQDGDSNADIASALHLSEETVKQHLRMAFARMGVETRTQAVVRLITGQVRLHIKHRPGGGTTPAMTWQDTVNGRRHRA